MKGMVSSKGSKVLKSICSNFNRTKCITFNDKTIEATGLKIFYSVGRAKVIFCQKVFKQLVRSLEITIEIGCAAAATKFLELYLLLCLH